MHLPQHGHRVADGLLHRLAAVLVHGRDILLAVGQAAGAVDAAAQARHALDEVAAQDLGVLAELEQRHAALLDAAANHGLGLKVDVLLLQGLGHGLAQAAHAGEDAAEVAGVVQHVLRQLADLHVLGVKQRLQLLEGHHRVDVVLHGVQLALGLLGRAGADEDHLGRRVGGLDVLGQRRHGAEVVADKVRQLREGGLDVAHESGAAGGGHGALLGHLFHQLLALGHRHQVRAQGRFDHRVEAQLLHAGDGLADLGVAELTGEGRGHNGIHLVILVALALPDHVDHVHDEGLVLNGAKGALVDARAALDALLIVDGGRTLGADVDGLDLAGVLAGALAVDDRAEGADLRALAALHALGLVDMGHMVVVEGDGLALAHVLAAVGQAATAGARHLIARSRALIAGDVDHLDDVGVLLVAAHGQLHALAQDGPLLVHAAAHGGHLAGHDGLGDLQHLFGGQAVPRAAGHLTQHLVLQILHLCVKLSHDNLPFSVLEITHLDALAHFPEALGQLLHQVHLDVEVDGQVRVLMGRVDGAADVEVDVRGLLEEQAADLARAVLPEAPVLIELVRAQIIPGIFDHLIDGDHALGDQIHALDGGRGGQVGGKVQVGAQGLAQVLGRNGGRGAAADDVLALFGEEQRHHPVRIVAVEGRAEEQVHRLTLPDLHHAGGGVVARLVAVEVVALVHQHRGQGLGSVAHGGQHRHEVDDVLPLPAEVVGDADARMGAAVAHGDEHVALLQAHGGLVDRLAADVHLRPGVDVVLVVPDEDDLRVVILDDFRGLIVLQVDDGEGGIRHATHGADRQRRRNGGHALLQRQALGQHGGDNLGGQGGQDRRLHAAAQAIGEHDHHRVLVRLHNVHMVAAQLLADVVDAFIADIRAKVIH